MRKQLAEKVFGSWCGILNPILISKYFKDLIDELEELYKTKEIYPKQSSVFRAFRLTNYNDLKIVILGMDPYPNSRANGLAFANSKEYSNLSPNLIKIRDRIEDQYYQGLDLNFDSTLESWAKQGILLINTALTVEKGKSGSHLKMWDEFLITLLKRLSEFDPGTIYCLWGNDAKGYKKYIDGKKNIILEAKHPVASIYEKGGKWEFNFKAIDEITTNMYGENIKW